MTSCLACWLLLCHWCHWCHLSDVSDVPACAGPHISGCGAPLPPAAALACVDEPFGGQFGDCTTYNAGYANEGRCDRDRATGVCRVSCGECTGGNPRCFNANFNFRRCCGGSGSPDCFPTPTIYISELAMTYDSCCETAVEPTVCEDHPGLSPDCPSLLASSYTCSYDMTQMLTRAHQSALCTDGCTVAQLCPETCGMCGGTAPAVPPPPPTPPPAAVAVDCGVLTVNHAISVAGGTTADDPAPTISCQPGYRLSGSAPTCSQSGSWSGMVTCNPMDCGTFPLLNGQLIGSTRYNGIAGVSCNPGFNVVGVAPICAADGVWSPADGVNMPACNQQIITCTQFTMPNGVATGDYFAGGAGVTVTCSNGFILTGDSVRHCVDLSHVGDWQEDLPVCVPIDCGVLTVTNGRITAGATTYNPDPAFHLTVICNGGYELDGHSIIKHCQVNGQWDDPVVACTQIDCDAFTVQDGVVAGSNVFEGGGVSVTCSQGFILNDDSLAVRECDEGGEWMAVAPTCDRIPTSCPGGAIEDQCGVCSGDGSSCAGCDGVTNSGVLNSVCGVCGGQDFLCCIGGDIPHSLTSFESTSAECTPRPGPVNPNCGLKAGGSSCAPEFCYTCEPGFVATGFHSCEGMGDSMQGGACVLINLVVPEPEPEPEPIPEPEPEPEPPTDLPECVNTNAQCEEFLRVFRCSQHLAQLPGNPRIRDICQISCPWAADQNICMHSAPPEVNECASGPCQHHGTCTDGDGTYTCDCPILFEGDNCEVHCACPSAHCTATRNPCQNGGTCSESNIGQAECGCADGYIGSFCGVVDPCTDGTCLNGGTCVEENPDTTPAGTDLYNCVCASGWVGNNCQTGTDECSLVAGQPRCANAGVCVDAFLDYSCNCIIGYQGDNCAIETDECKSNPCQNSGTCGDALVSYVCNCVAGHTGDDCEIDVLECSSLPCQNGGLCLDLIDLYNCQCTNGYMGNQCEVDIDECRSRPCAIGGTCLTDGGPDQYRCACDQGWEGDLCDGDVAECQSSPCSHGGDCSDTGDFDQYSCKCVAGWAGDNCVTDVNECDSSPCPREMDCVDSVDAWDCAVRPQPAPEPEPELPVALLVAGPSSAPAPEVGTTVVPIVGGVLAVAIVLAAGVAVMRSKSSVEKAEKAIAALEAGDRRMRLADGSVSEFDVEQTGNPLAGGAVGGWAPPVMARVIAVKTLKPGQTADDEDDI